MLYTRLDSTRQDCSTAQHGATALRCRCTAALFSFCPPCLQPRRPATDKGCLYKLGSESCVPSPRGNANAMHIGQYIAHVLWLQLLSSYYILLILHQNPISLIESVMQLSIVNVNNANLMDEVRWSMKHGRVYVPKDLMVGGKESEK